MGKIPRSKFIFPACKLLCNLPHIIYIYQSEIWRSECVDRSARIVGKIPLESLSVKDHREHLAAEIKALDPLYVLLARPTLNDIRKAFRTLLEVEKGTPVYFEPKTEFYKNYLINSNTVEDSNTTTETSGQNDMEIDT